MTLFFRLVVAPGVSPLFMAAYWGAWLLLLLVAMYCVLLDLRFLRAQFLDEERALFHATLAEEEFRRAVLEAQRAQLADDLSNRRTGQLSDNEN